MGGGLWAAGGGSCQPPRSLGQRGALRFRTAVNAQSGVCTPAGGLVTGRAPDPAVGCSAGPRAQHPLPLGTLGVGDAAAQVLLSPAGALVLLSLAYLTSLFYYIPKAALAAVIISAVVPMFDAGIFRTLWRVKSEGTR